MIKRIQCYDCQENNFGNCAKGIDIKTKRCFDNAISCYGTVFYSPYNNGYGAKYMFTRGCSTCNTSDCLVNDTQRGFGLLPEYIGNHFICKYSSCNTNPLEQFKVDLELGIKPH
ncbi:hypothetical protein WA026_022583 [Henosepilachna vigintioctopunctata]|uniref:Uncharacterized protein n=1 Tax=Henosepilachna vigintioctopunctata TaxID=420089 RepID=A0AAW1VJJ7_9CUCU